MSASLDPVPAEAATDADIDAVFGWLGAPEPPPAGIRGVLDRCRTVHGKSDVWLLAHCVDGVVWGCVEPAGTPRIASGSPDSGPPIPYPTRSNVLELRLFGANAELLLWRDGVASQQWSGRWLDDALPSPAHDDPLLASRPVPILALGTPVPVTGRQGDTLLADGAGRRHLVPLVLNAADDGAPPAVLDTHQYLTREESGVVRVVASRLVGLRARGPGELHVGARPEEAP